MNSLLDDVNALLKLKQGDLGRLEHIKTTLESRNVLYISDTKYLRELTREYLEDRKGQRLERFNSYDYPEYTNRLKIPTSEEEKEAEQMAKNLKEADDTSGDGKESKQLAKKLKEFWTTEAEQMAKNLKESGEISGEISEYVKKPTPEILDSNKNYFCGNCGNTIKNENFCVKCGSSLHIVEKEEKQYDVRFRKNQPQENSTKNEARISVSTLVIVILFGVITVGGIAMGVKILGENEIQIDNVIEATPVIVTTTPTSGSELDSKCGAGTVLNEAGTSCVLPGSKIADESSSKCGTGTVLNEAGTSCVLPGN